MHRNEQAEEEEEEGAGDDEEEEKRESRDKVIMSSERTSFFLSVVFVVRVHVGRERESRECLDVFLLKSLPFSLALSASTRNYETLESTQESVFSERSLENNKQR